MNGWWIEKGTEFCNHCYQHYPYEMEYRCIHCDLPVCPLCVVSLKDAGEPICPECEKSCEEE